MTTNFYRVGSSAPRPTPTWRTRVSLLICYAAAGISFRAHWCTQAPSPSNKMLSTRWRHHREGGVFSFSQSYSTGEDTQTEKSYRRRMTSRCMLNVSPAPDVWEVLRRKLISWWRYINFWNRRPYVIWKSWIIYKTTLFIPSNSAQNGNLEVPAYFLKTKQEYTAKKMGKDEWI
jgi:hypothetical protein